MAQKIKIMVTLLDDLDQKQGTETTADVTTALSFNGRAVELDLTHNHVEEIDKLLTPYFEAGRKVKTAGARAPVRGTSLQATKQLFKEMRLWGRAHSTKTNQWAERLDKSDYIPVDLQNAFAAAHGIPQAGSR